MYVKSEDESSTLYFEVKISKQDGITYTNIKEITKTKISLWIHNCSDYLIHLSSEQNPSEPVQTIEKSHTSVPLILKEPAESGHLLSLNFELNNQEEELNPVKVNLVKIFPPTLKRLNDTNGVIISLKIQGKKKIIKIENENSKIRRNYSILSGIQVQVILPKCSVSVSDFTSYKKREEILNFWVKGTFLIFSIEDEKFDVKLIVNEIQLENMIDLNSEHTAVLGNYEYSPDNSQRLNDVVQFGMKLRRGGNTSYVYFEALELKLLGFKVEMEEGFLTSLISFGEKLLNILSEKIPEEVSELISKNLYYFGKEITSDTEERKTKKKFYDEVYEVEERKLKFGQKWKLAHLHNFTSFYFVEELSLPSLAIEFSFIQDSSRLMKEDMDAMSIMGNLIGGIEDARVTMDGFKYQ
jgi:hypothetical protein